ncbi:hypothetical protein GWI33_000177 [Rhynchophorus ferrugineus]|uniref:Mos1 transposase HTH domain-containing protein n=1 Tax=Rhynchophorus ferrugineus TaxID=354439 RepID=A0A834IWM7_RHYFE|nr:hypothetical protein GWI33_000177 [Rhynchophorus ferrugineus]
MDNKEFRVLIKYCFLKGKNTVEAKTWLDPEFPNTAPGKSTIKDCYSKFTDYPYLTEETRSRSDIAGGHIVCLVYYSY